jgi:hypothetical protein
MVKSPVCLDELFKGRHFEREIIILCVRWYLRFKLSVRDLVEMMAERGLSLVDPTIMHWVQGLRRNSNAAGTALPVNQAIPDTLMRPISRSAASGFIFTEPWTGGQDH